MKSSENRKAKKIVQKTKMVKNRHFSSKIKIVSNIRNNDAA